MAADAAISLLVTLILVPVTLIVAVAFLMLGTRSLDHRLKRLRYEAGNPPEGRSRFPTLYQYFGYVVMFIALDPVFMLLFLLPVALAEWGRASVLTLVSVLVLLPPIVYAVRYAKRVDYWSLE
ncbi:MAG: NADH-quinone oxidoreductase subunit A [Thermoproteota archaeon]